MPIGSANLKNDTHNMFAVEVAVDLPNIATVDTDDIVVTVPGVRYEDSQGNKIDGVVGVEVLTALTHGLFIQSARVTGDNEVTLSVSNVTAGGINNGAVTMRFHIARY